MALKDILVACNATDHAQPAVRMALGLGKHHDAHVTGIIAHGMSLVLSHLGPWASEEVYSIVARNDEALRDGVRKAFETCVAEMGCADRVTYLDAEGEPDSVFSGAARSRDLVVMGPSTSSQSTAHFAPHAAEIALRSGRPVLYVPDVALAEPDPDHVVVAWDGRKSAARALADAQVFLRGASRVSVVTVGDAPDRRTPGGEEVVAHLARHAISADAVTIERDKRGIALCLLDHCAESRADLLVMGAYEHSKISEDLFGGVTNRILRDAPIPVMLSH